MAKFKRSSVTVVRTTVFVRTRLIENGIYECSLDGTTMANHSLTKEFTQYGKGENEQDAKKDYCRRVMADLDAR